MRDVTKKLTLSFMTFALLLVALEVFLRIAVPVDQPSAAPPSGKPLPWLEYHPFLGWMNRPNYEGSYRKPGVFDTTVRINFYGMRGPAFHAVKDPGTCRVLVLGDSFTFGHGVENDETFAALLDAALPEAEVVNTAVVGTGHDQQLLWLKQEGMHYQPDVILWGWSSADIPRNTLMFWRLRDPHTGVDFAKPRFVLRDGALELINVPTPRPEQIPAAIAGLREKDRSSRGALRRALRSLRVFRLLDDRLVNVREKQDQLAVSRAILDEMIRFAAEHKVELVIVHLPVRKWISGRNPLTAVKRGITGRMLQAAVHGRDATLIDLTPAFEARRAELDRVFLPDDGHYTPRGHALVADRLKPLLEPLCAIPVVEP